MTLWWLQPGWRETECGQCGRRIWPEGDPDWGLCCDCFTRHLEEQQQQSERCDVCGQANAVTMTNGRAVCSEECCRAAESGRYLTAEDCKGLDPPFPPEQGYDG